MTMHGDTQKQSPWNRFSNNVAAQVIITLVVATILIGLAVKYIW